MKIIKSPKIINRKRKYNFLIYIYIKSQHNQIKAVFENKNCKNNKKIKDSKKTLPIKLRKGSVDDIIIIKIKKKQIM